MVVKDFPRKIETLCPWGDQLLAGLQEGSLLFFKRSVPGPAPSSDGADGDCAQAEGLAWQVRFVYGAPVTITQSAVTGCTVHKYC